MRQLLLCASTVLLLAVPALAHGGQYRGPTTDGVARDNMPDPASWQGWWENNREPHLRRRTAPAKPVAPVTGVPSDAPGTADEPWPFRVTDLDLRDRIVPALLAALAETRSRDVQTACMIALAKIGRDGPGLTLESVLLPRLQRDDQEVRETAALALGIAGRPADAPHLLALLRDDADGRKLVGAALVPERVRAFATYGLALVARRSGEAALQQRAADAFWALLKVPASGASAARDLRVAAVLGLGAMHDPANSVGKRLAWQIVDDMLVWLGREQGPGEEFVQAQVPIAIARLLGRGDSATHQRCKRAFVKLLTASSPRGNPLLQSAAIALGAMALPAEQCADDAEVATALRDAYDRGAEANVLMFAVMALGRIGGDANRKWLLTAYANGNKLKEKPWLALALGVLAQGRALSGAVDAEVARLLLVELGAASGEDLRAALALAVGLARERSASPKVRAMLTERAENERTAGYLCTSLGLLGDPAAIPDLVAVIGRALRRPFVLQAAALACNQLGDDEIITRLVTMLGESESVVTLSGLANAIGRSRDRRAIEPLLALLAKKDLPQLGRAFAVAALGWLGDENPLPWNQPFAVDANFACQIDTLSNGTTGILDIL